MQYHHSSESDSQKVSGNASPDTTKQEVTLADANGPKRNWPRTWAITLAMLAGGWTVNQVIKSDSDKTAATKDEVKPEDPIQALLNKAKPPEIVFPSENFYSRFEENGDLGKEAYLEVNNGFFNYEFLSRDALPTKIEITDKSQPQNETKPDEQKESPPLTSQAKRELSLEAIRKLEPLAVIKGIPPGPDNLALLSEFASRGIVVRDGESFSRLREQAYAVEKIEAEKLLALEKESFQTLRSLIVWGVVIGGILYLGKKISDGAKKGMLNPFSSGSKGDVLTDRPKEGFDHIGGIAQVVAQMKFLKEDIALRQGGDANIDLDKGILLYGPPGTGKTMLARALAAETSCPYVSFKGSELSTQFFVGSGVASVREAFEKARKLRDEHTAELRRKGSPNARGVCIVFIDEFDSLAQRRSHGFGGEVDKEETKVVNTLLAEMDNLSKELNRDIIVLAATNSIDVLDPAAIRPGRFNRRIEVPQPDSKEARLEVLEKTMRYKFNPKGFTLDEAESLNRLAALTKGSSAAELVGILEKAASISTRDRRKNLTFNDLMEGLLQEEIGFRSERKVPIEERRKTAWHELAGHALMAHYCGISTRMISMQPRGQALGFVIPDPEAISEFSPTKGELLRQVLLAVGGTVAEAKKYTESGRTLGNAQDLDQARRYLRQLISTGLLGDSLAQSLVERDPRTETLSDTHREVLDLGLNRAIETARKIIDKIDPEILENFIEAALGEKVELIGKDAEQFIEEHLVKRVPKEVASSIDGDINEFLADPLGRSAAA